MSSSRESRSTQVRDTASMSPFRMRKYMKKDEKLKGIRNDVFLFNTLQYDKFLNQLHQDIIGDPISSQTMKLWKIMMDGRVFKPNGIVQVDDLFYGTNKVKKGIVREIEDIGDFLIKVLRKKSNLSIERINELSVLSFKQLLTGSIEEAGKENTHSYIPFFEKRLFGVFLYANYLQMVNEDICVPITDIDGLISGLKRWMVNINNLSKEEFINKYILLMSYYDEILELKKKSTKSQHGMNEYIYYLINNVLLWMSPFILITESSVIPDKLILQVSNTFEKLFERCRNPSKGSSKKFIVIPFLFHYEKCTHANMLIVNTKEKTVERFEPQGAITYGERFECPQSFADKELSKLFKKYNYEYLSPKTTCPLIGPQHEYETKKKISQEEGYCVTWSMIYANMRLYHLSSSEKTMQNMTNDIIKHILEIMDDETKKGVSDLNITEWIDIYFQDRLGKIMSYFQKNIDKVNKEFGTDFIVDENRELRY